MLTAEELAQRLLASAAGRIPVEEFEEWFDSNSWNVHKQRDQDMIDAVFHVEESFSSYADGRVDESALRRSLEEIAHELLSHELVFLEEPYALADTENVTLDFTFTGGVQRIHPATPRWFPVAGPIRDEELAFGV
jgi:hypothetical protein